MGEAGAGGFGTVQVAWDTRIQRKVAIKCIEVSESDALRMNRASGGHPAAAENVSGGHSAASENAPAPQAKTRVLDDIPPWEDLPEDFEQAGVTARSAQNLSNGGDAVDSQGEAGSGGITANDVTAILGNAYPPEEDTPSPVGEAAFPETASGSGDGSVSVLLSPAQSFANIPGLDEARTAAMLQDPHIVTVYDFEVQGSTAYLIMEYVEGMTLADFLAEYNDELTLDIIACVFSAVSRALEVAHAHQVLHLDIKPANVLIDAQGQVKVTDFGLSTLADANGEGTTGGGTIGYMPLEQMRLQTLDARCDEWALASLTYEMLSGENPFAARDLPHAEAAIENAELVLPSLCWDDADEGIDDVMFYALDPDPDERYDTVSDFAQELMPYLGSAKRGKRQLEALISGVGDEEKEEDGAVSGRDAVVSPKPHAALVDRVGERGGAIIARIFAVAASALLALVALANVPFLAGGGLFANPVFWIALAVPCVLAVFKPPAGISLGFVMVGVSLVSNGAFAPGIALGAAAALWWWYAGRGESGAAVAVSAQPLFGAFGFAALSPILAGVLVPSVIRAAAAALFAAIAAVSLASLGTLSPFDWNAFANWDFSSAAGAASNAVLPDGASSAQSLGSEVQDRFFRLLSRPATWCVAGSWVAAAAAIGLFGLRGSKAFDVVGAFVGGLVLSVGTGLALWVGAGSPTAEPLALAAAICSGAVGVVLAALGVSDKVRQ